MAILEITTNKTAAEMEVELANSAICTRVGGNGRIFRCTDHINIKAECSFHGFTLIFADNKYLYSSTATGHIKAGYSEGENIVSPLTIIFEGSTGVDDNTVDNNNSFVKTGSKWTSYGLNIIIPSPTAHLGVNLYEPNSDSIFERINIEVGDEVTSYVSYFSVGLSSNSQVSIEKLRRLNFRYISGNISFIENGYGWFRSQGGQENLKLLGTDKTFKQFIPKFITSTSWIETSSTVFGVTAMNFLDSKIESSRIHAYPKNNNGVVRTIQRTFKFKPTDSQGLPVDGFSIEIRSNRVASSGYSGATSGDTQLYELTGKNYDDEQIVQVFRGYRATLGDTTYKGLANTLSDKEITLKMRHYGYLQSILLTNTEFGAYQANIEFTTDNAISEGNSTTVSNYAVISDANRLYDRILSLSAQNFSIPFDLITANGQALTIKTGWALKAISGGSGTALDINTTTKIITAKLGVNGLLKTEKFSALLGTIDSSFDGNTDMQYTKSNGKVSISINLSSEAGANSAVFGVWPKSQGTSNRTGILTAPGNGLIDVTPNTEMYFVADAVNAYRSQPVEFTAGAFGNVLSGNLTRIKKGDGTNLLPDALLVAQQRIADMMNYNQAAARVDITLPSNYASDERWNSTTNTWTFKSEDFWPLAYKAEQIQSSEGSLIDPSVVVIDSYTFTLSAASTLTFRQDVNNINCTINMNAFIIKRQGDTEQANTFVDHSNGVILVNAGSLIIATVETPASVLSGVTNDLKIVNNNIKDILKLDPTGSGFQDIP